MWKNVWKTNSNKTPKTDTLLDGSQSKAWTTEKVCETLLQQNGLKQIYTETEPNIFFERKAMEKWILGNVVVYVVSVNVKQERYTHGESNDQNQVIFQKRKKRLKPQLKSNYLVK